jgi:predicted GTPase
MEQRAVVRFLTFRGLKAKEIEMKLTNVYGDEALQISAVKKQRMRFLQGRTELGYDLQSRRPTNSDLTQVIAELIRESPFRSCKILCRHLKVSKETYFRFLHKKLGFKKFHLQSIPHQLIPNMKASRVSMSHQFLEILQHRQTTDFVNFLTEDESRFF